MNSALVTGVGPVRLTGPLRSVVLQHMRMPPTSSSSETHGMNWVPDPSRPPRNGLNSGLSVPSSPPAGERTRPVRRCTTRAPASLAFCADASHSRHTSARKPPPEGDALVRPRAVRCRRRTRRPTPRGTPAPRARPPRWPGPRWGRCGCHGSAACGRRSTAGPRSRPRRGRPPRRRRRTCRRRCGPQAGPSPARPVRRGRGAPGAGRRGRPHGDGDEGGSDQTGRPGDDDAHGDDPLGDRPAARADEVVRGMCALATLSAHRLILERAFLQPRSIAETNRPASAPSTRRWS